MTITLDYLFQFTLFTVLVIILFYLPGYYFCTRLSPKLINQHSVFIVVGIVVWTVQAYLFGIIGFRSASLFYLLIIWYLLFKERLKLLRLNWEFQVNKTLLLVLIVGTVTQLFFIFPSGLKDAHGYWFFQINAFDGMYYLALAKKLITSIPPFEPGLSGELVVNYHYLSSLTIAEIAKWFPINELILHFQMIPILISVVRGLLIYQVTLAISKSKNAGIIATTFSFFATDLGFLTSALLLGNWSVEAIQPIDSAHLLLVNMPRAMAEVIFLSGFILFLKGFTEKNHRLIIFSEFILMSTIGFKVYVGIYAAIIIIISTLYLLKTSRRRLYLYAFAIITLLGALLYYPTNAGAGGLLWEPFAWPRHYFASTGLSNLNWHLKEQVFKAHNNFLRLYMLYFQETIIFLLTIFGLRLIGLIPIRKYFDLKNIRFTDNMGYFLLYISAIIFIFIGTFTLQVSGIYNVFNFYSTAAFSLVILTATVIDHYFKKNKLMLIIVLIVLLAVNLPRIYHDIRSYFTSMYSKQNEAYLVDNLELETFSYLDNNTTQDSVILVDPKLMYNHYSPYVEYFSNRATYLSNLFILEAHNQNIGDRLNKVDAIFSSGNMTEVREKIDNEKIDYIYLIKPTDGEDVSIGYQKEDVFFENSKTLVLKI